MPRMNILNTSELERFQSPPIFNSDAQKRYFDFPEGIQAIIDNLRTPTNQVCFLISFGYFRASKKFFPGRFHSKDIEYVANKLGIKLEEVSIKSYGKQTWLRHQTLILDCLGFGAFDEQAQQLVIEQIQSLVRSQTRAKRIFQHIVDFLIQKKIEIPSYHLLSYLILGETNKHKQELTQVVEQQLTTKVRELLDRLLDKEDSLDVEHSKIRRYRLTLLKRFSQSRKPSKIRENVEDFQTLHNLYQEVKPVLKSLDLSQDGVRYFATSVLKAQTSQLLLKSEEDRYLHIIAFIAHQYYRLHDMLIDVLILSTKATVNKVQRLHKEKCYEQRPRQSQQLNKFVNELDNNLISPMKRIEIIVNNDSLSDCQKVTQVKAILAERKAERSEVEHQINCYRDETEKTLKDNDYYSILESRSLHLQNRVSLIVKHLNFDSLSSCPNMMEAINHYRQRNGQLTKNAPMAFLERKEQGAVIAEGKFRISLYKVLLFINIAEAVKAGTLNLGFSYKYRPLDDYMIPKDDWKKNRNDYLNRADLGELADCKKTLQNLEKELDKQYHKINRRILKSDNPHVTFRKDGLFTLATPGVETPDLELLSDLFPKRDYISLLEVLSTANEFTNFLDEFDHWQVKYDRQIPSKKNIIAGIMALGCFIGTRKFSRISKQLNSSELETAVNWRFTAETVTNANDRVLEFMDQLDLPNVYRQDKGKLHTSSDGQKYEVARDSLNASYSYKYFGHKIGVSAASFIDERNFLFFGNVFSSAEREAAYVIDGLMHNDVVKSDIHSTDTHGYSEVIFGVAYLLGFLFGPRIKNLKKAQLYSFRNRKRYAQCGYKILPHKYINAQIIETHWDEILRFIATIKLKVTTASQLFRRLNSYSRQHNLYRALKAFGQILKSIFILRYIDDLPLRQAIEKQLNKSENSNKFSKAVSLGNQEFLRGEKEEQELAEGCRRLIKNSIVCWNYLYLSQKLSNESNLERRAEMLDIIKHGSIATWQHINLHGEYDFSDDNLCDSVGLNPDRLLHFNTFRS